MYEQSIRDLSSLFKGKREKAIQYLRGKVMRNPRGVVENFMKYADEKAWSYAGQNFSANNNGVLLTILANRLSPQLERILGSIGYAAYIPKLKEFWKLYDEVDGYRKRGIGVDKRKYYFLLKGGKVEDALKGIREEAERGRDPAIKQSGSDMYSQSASAAQRSYSEVSNAQKAAPTTIVETENRKLENGSKRVMRKNGLDALRTRLLFWNMTEIFTKVFHSWIWSVHGFEAGNEAYFVVNEGEHIYDERGKEIFIKELYEKSRNKVYTGSFSEEEDAESVYGFNARGGELHLSGKK